MIQPARPIAESDYGDAFPNSRKVFSKARNGARVPMREIRLGGGEAPLRVYDTSGALGVDVREGLPRIREQWIEARSDVERVATDAEAAALLNEVRTWPNVQALLARPAAPPSGHELVVPCVLDIGGQRLSLFTTLATFGAPRDVTLAELTVELFYPADAATEAALRYRGTTG